MTSPFGATSLPSVRAPQGPTHPWPPSGVSPSTSSRPATTPVTYRRVTDWPAPASKPETSRCPARAAIVLVHGRRAHRPRGCRRPAPGHYPAPGRRGAPRGRRRRVQARAPGETSQTAHVAVLTRYEIWMRRVRREKLGAWSGTWADLSSTTQYAAWRQLAEARGATADVPGYLTSSLLSEVIYAAGGVERELGQLRKALEDMQQFTGEAAARPSRSSEEGLVFGSYGAAPPVREASYSFVNLLSWARSTVDRTDRRYGSRSPERAGLLPALADGQLRDSVEAALQHLRAALRDSEFLASYAVHAGAVPGGEHAWRGDPA